MKDFDLLLIINFYSDWKHLESFRLDKKKVLILSTHHLFTSEKKKIQNILSQSEVHFLRYDFWNERIDPTKIDGQAFKEIKRSLFFTSIFHTVFFEKVSYYKNEFLYQQLVKDKIINKQTAIHVLCDSIDVFNLGISYTFWKTKGNILKPNTVSSPFTILKKIKRIPLIRFISYFIQAFLFAFKPIQVTKVCDQDLFYITNLKRVQLKKELKASKVWIIPFFIQFKEGFLTAPIHQATSLLSTYPFIKKSKIVVIQDAFRPTSYPIYFSALAFSGTKIITRDQIDYRYYKSANIPVYEPGLLLNPTMMPTEYSHKGKTIQTVCLSLNHSGNWTSLISRCDTDSLIEIIAELAIELKELNFIVRLHPTSDNLRGEGYGWSKRIRNLVTQLNRPNLSVSTVSLEEDWQRADLFISEYSLSVVDAIKYGKLAVFFNPTNRISFMKDLTKVGFKEVHSKNALKHLIMEWGNNPQKAFKEIITACEKYNNTYINNFSFPVKNK